MKNLGEDYYTALLPWSNRMLYFHIFTGSAYKAMQFLLYTQHRSV